MIAQKLLGQDLAAAAVAIDAAQIKGVLPLPLSALRATLPVFKNPANKHRAVSLTAEQFRYAFGNAISEEESRRAVRALDHPRAGQAAVRGRRRQLQPALPGQGGHRQRAARTAAADHGRQDHTVPEAVTRATLKQYRHSDAITDITDFPDRAHSLTIDHGWREVADTALSWLRRHAA